MTELMCPDCGGELEIDEMLLNQKSKFEVVCYNCGWFDMPRYETIEEAQKRIDGGEV
jgi:uncharacterized Zn finger protein